MGFQRNVSWKELVAQGSIRICQGTLSYAVKETGIYISWKELVAQGSIRICQGTLSYAVKETGIND
jgi:methylphosphotriester-DNA--protein-cysteine methyltransferase